MSWRRFLPYDIALVALAFITAFLLRLLLMLFWIKLGCQNTCAKSFRENVLSLDEWLGSTTYFIMLLAVGVAVATVTAVRLNAYHAVHKRLGEVALGTSVCAGEVFYYRKLKQSFIRLLLYYAVIGIMLILSASAVFIPST